MGVNLLTVHNLEFVSLKEGCTGLSESTLVKMPHCWKSPVTTQLCSVPYGLIACILIFCQSYFQETEE